MTLPNVFIGGAPKSGTSSLYFWLSAHPEVCGSKPKETFYFYDEIVAVNKNACYKKHKLSQFEQYFAHCKRQKIVFEATPFYLYQQTALEAIPLLLTNPVMVFILREPAMRVYSYYKFHRYRVKNIGKLSFKEYLDKYDDQTQFSPIEQGSYYKYIQQWYHKLGKERVKVYLMDDMHKDQVGFMKRLAVDLGIDPEFYDDYVFHRHNETVAVKSKKMHRFGLKMQSYVPGWLQEKILLPIYFKLNSGKVPAMTAEEKALVETLKKRFAPDNKKLEELLGLDLSAWY